MEISRDNARSPQDRTSPSDVSLERAGNPLPEGDGELCRPVKGNSHIELTTEHDIRQICYDIKNLIEYARTHRARSLAPAGALKGAV